MEVSAAPVIDNSEELEELKRKLKEKEQVRLAR